MYNWYRNIFHAFAVLIVFHAANEKLEENKIKTREQNKGRKIKTLLSSPIHLAHHRSTVEPLLLRCCTDIATLSLCCRSAVALISHRYRSAVSTPLLLSCRTDVAPLSHRYRSTVAPLLSLLMLLRSRTAISPVSLHCRSAAVAIQSHRYRTGIAPLLLRCCRACCRYTVAPLLRHSCSAAVAPSVAPLLHCYHATVSPLLPLLLSLRSRTAITLLSHRC